MNSKKKTLEVVLVLLGLIGVVYSGVDPNRVILVDHQG